MDPSEANVSKPVPVPYGNRIIVHDVGRERVGNIIVPANAKVDQLMRGVVLAVPDGIDEQLTGCWKVPPPGSEVRFTSSYVLEDYLVVDVEDIVAYDPPPALPEASDAS